MSSVFTIALGVAAGILIAVAVLYAAQQHGRTFATTAWSLKWWIASAIVIAAVGWGYLEFADYQRRQMIERAQQRDREEAEQLHNEKRQRDKVTCAEKAKAHRAKCQPIMDAYEVARKDNRFAPIPKEYVEFAADSRVLVAPHVPGGVAGMSRVATNLPNQKFRIDS